MTRHEELIARCRAVRVATRSRHVDVLAGSCRFSADAPGSITIELPALGFSVCNAR